MALTAGFSNSCFPFSQLFVLHEGDVVEPMTNNDEAVNPMHQAIEHYDLSLDDEAGLAGFDDVSCHDDVADGAAECCFAKDSAMPL